MADNNTDVFKMFAVEDRLDGDDYPMWAYMMQHVLVSKGIWNIVKDIDVCPGSEDVAGWEVQPWTAFIALLLLVIVGTKLQVIITNMALRYNRAHTLALGVPNVKPTDELFWFHRPRITLWCIHFILFQNALDLSFVVWVVYKFPGDNCVKNEKNILIVRLVVGLVTQALCGLVTLPSYALVSQMGTNLKPSMFEKDIQVAITQWHKRAKDHLHHEIEGLLGDRHQNHIPQSQHSLPTHLEMSHV
ncbi:hypothetical protein L7F22_060175 [Adiantum nelumboides]|nr:hypothetical protein [Adiantum nelumboides]